MSARLSHALTTAWLYIQILAIGTLTVLGTATLVYLAPSWWRWVRL